MADPSAASSEAFRLFLLVLGICAVEAIVLDYAILRSGAGGVSLVTILFMTYFGIKFLQPQIEALAFGVLPGRLLGQVLIMGLVMSLLLAPLLVLILGRLRRPAGDRPAAAMPARQWMVKLGATALFYLALYLTFGLLIAWPRAEVRGFYGATPGPDLFDSFGFDLPVLGILIPLQLLRGLLWVAIAWPLLRRLRTGPIESGLIIGLLFAVLMNAQLLLPNPFMPADVRMIHLLETAPSNFLLGFWVGWLFRRRHESFGALFRAA